MLLIYLLKVILGIFLADLQTMFIFSINKKDFLFETFLDKTNRFVTNTALSTFLQCVPYKRFVRICREISKRLSQQWIRTTRRFIF